MTGKLIFIGLGLWDEKDITYKGLQAIKTSDICLAESYTSALFGSTQEKLEKLVAKPITFLSREVVEKEDEIIQLAKKKSVAFLTGGDPMTATTHLSLRLRALREGIPTQVIHGISIITAAAGVAGLQTYKFGRITTLAYPYKNYLPESPYQVIRKNLEDGLHSLILLDIDAEQKRYMTASEGIGILLEIEKHRKKRVFHSQRLVVVIARVSSPSMVVKAGYPNVLVNQDFGAPLHTLIVPGDLHPLEAESLVEFADAPTEIKK